MAQAIAFHDVWFSYEDTPILKNVSFEVEEGQLVGVIGPNGGGKTTLLKLLMGFLTPTDGEIKVFEKSPEDIQKKIAYVPQNLRYDRYFPISVLELVLMGRLAHLPWWGKYSQEDERAALKALQTVGIADCINDSVGTLSGGQFQRALIARALVSDPVLMLLDEPTANVDTQAEKEIYKLLKHLAGTMTIMMVTHDLNVAVNLVDTILCVQTKVTPMRPNQVCEHFAMGLYHPPLMEGK